MLDGLTAPTQENLSGPILASTGYDTPTFSWNSIPGAAFYNLNVKDNTTGTTVISNASVSTNSYAPGPLLAAGHSYTWYVGAEGQLAASGPITWSGSASFSLATLMTPTPGNPSGPISATTGYDTPTFSWNSISGASNYYLYVTDTTTNTVVINTSSVSLNTFTPGSALMQGHSFTWYVGAERRPCRVWSHRVERPGEIHTHRADGADAGQSQRPPSPPPPATIRPPSPGTASPGPRVLPLCDGHDHEHRGH